MPIDTAAPCGASRPRPSRRAMATGPSKVHQNPRRETGASILPPAVIVSITRDPECDEVTEKTAFGTSAGGPSRARRP